MLVWLVLAAVTVLILAWRSSRRPAWSPCGPPLLPWLGNALAVDSARPDASYARWADTYGDMYHVKFGVQHQVVLSEPGLIREAFARPEVAGRPDTEAVRFLKSGTGLAFSQGEVWRESRRLTLHHLRSLGMGKSELEEFMHKQITSFIDDILTPSCGTEIGMDASLNVAIVNIIWKLVASEELGITDEKVQSVIVRLAKTEEATQSLSILDAAPWLSPVMPNFIINKSKIEKAFSDIMEEAFLPCLQRHRDKLDVSGEPRDYMDAMLQEQRKRPELMTDWHLLMSFLDLFIAGSDTTATTLRWAFCFLCNRPECQQRLQAELDAQVGRQRLPSLADRPWLPYTEAVLLETQRLADIAPILLPHQTLAPVTVGGYQLPAGVQVIGNVQSVHRSQRFFTEPLQFRPERFLDEDDQFRPDKNVMPFSVGRRQCLGEALARAELFLFLTAFMQNFSFHWPEGFRHDLSEHRDSVFVRSPTPYKLIPDPR